MRIAIAQLNPTIGDLAGNSERILAAAAAADREGANLLLTPELSLCGYPPRDLLLDPGLAPAMAAQLATLARSLPPALAVLVGTATPNPQADNAGEKPLFNSIALLGNGCVQQIFHKRLLPTYDVFDEHRYFAAGQHSNYFELSDDDRGSLRIGVTVCEDLWNDEEFWGKRSYRTNPIAELSELGVDLVVNLSASPYSVGKQPLRESMLAHSARRFQQPIVYVNQVGGNDDLIFDGGSFACDRSGTTVLRARAFDTDLLTVDYDRACCDLTPGTVAALPDCREAEFWQALVLGTRDYARKCGFNQATIGLSGGIDSSLVAAIATAALGPENVLGVLMPSPYSSEGSIADAQALVANLGIDCTTLPIADAMDAYDRVLEPLFAGTEFGVAEENIQSRIRGNLLMAIANKFNRLLLSTGNKSEMAVGYCTLYGDMNGGLAVIADLPKTQVYALCCWLNRDRELIPAEVIRKPPSAELRPGQLDSDSLPSYDVLDDILHRLIHLHESAGQIVAAGYDPEVVRKVVKLVLRSEFKRRQAPPGLKVTDRAFGTGWRMPIASRRTAAFAELDTPATTGPIAIGNASDPSNPTELAIGT
ncbi:NAD+ synthetase [Rubidibacter lacunae KORDI 51-2]|uniref:Glutamine-dependent NAD(+) synthetase n=1 Tax=Rubidibacter lacunae KORDI 51-2 TaxID=582515 RepID=U5DE77_9CHRO|nr:NAD+ synthase [Rubidibacter lacunae]ERN42813.1 NAD+ synthetase [Rubidibacter lacunae KORDI 51-2]